jgi:hypothetical protein
MSIFTKRPTQKTKPKQGNVTVQMPGAQTSLKHVAWWATKRVAVAFCVPFLALFIAHNSFVMINQTAFWAIKHGTAPAISWSISLMEDVTNVRPISEAQAAVPAKIKPQQTSSLPEPKGKLSTANLLAYEDALDNAVAMPESTVQAALHTDHRKGKK